MRWSIASQALYGASAVCAATLLDPLQKRAESLPLESFGSFDTISLEEANAGLAKALQQAEEFAEAIGDIIDDAQGIKATGSGKTSSKVDDDTDYSKDVEDTVDKLGSTACRNPNIRFEWRDYSNTDRRAFVSAISCLINKPPSGHYPPSTNRYEDLVQVHQVSVKTVHGNNIFLLWHRYYVWSFEQILREECGFDRAFPWWNEAIDAGDFAGSSLFTDSYFGSLPEATSGAGTCITDGEFANLTCHMGPGGGNTDHCLARAVDESLTALANQDFVNSCNNHTTYPDMENCAELGPHAYTHNGIGSVMSDVAASPGDPIFFMHHLFIDRNYWTWQSTDAARRLSISGCADANSPCTPLTLKTVISVNGLRPDVTVADVINTEGGLLCYNYTY